MIINLCKIKTFLNKNYEKIQNKFIKVIIKRNF